MIYSRQSACACRLILFLIITFILVPSTPLAAKEKPLSIKVMTLNLHRGRDSNGRDNLESFLKLIESEKPDIVALQEIERRHLQTLKLSGWNIVVGFNANRPGFRFGNLIMTSHRIVYQRHHYLPSKLEQRGINEVALEIKGQYLRVINCHLGLGKAERESQLEEVIRIMGFLEGPLLVVGDFNAGSDNRVFTKFPEGFSEAGTVYSLPYTYPTVNPRFRIDMIWFSEHWELQEAQVLPWYNSDHLPVTAELRLREEWRKFPLRTKIPGFDLRYNPLLPDIGSSLRGAGWSFEFYNEQLDTSKVWVSLPVWQRLGAPVRAQVRAPVRLGGENSVRSEPEEFDFFIKYRFKEIDFRDYFSLWGMRGKAEFSIFFRTGETGQKKKDLFGVEQYYRWHNHLGSRVITIFSDKVLWTVEGIYLPTEQTSLRINLNEQGDIKAGASYAFELREKESLILDGNYSFSNQKLSLGAGFYW